MTCHRFIAPEHLPAEYGGLRRNNDQDFTPDDKVLEHKVRANSISRIELCQPLKVFCDTIKHANLFSFIVWIHLSLSLFLY
jgi:hypothetical protein